MPTLLAQAHVLNPEMVSWTCEPSDKCPSFVDDQGQRERCLDYIIRKGL